jgi:hypothetical protein
MNTPPIEFKAWPKIYRLKREVIITEKIDGTNAGILISTQDSFPHLDSGVEPGIYASSRKRWITPENDNYGFARWVQENEETLTQDLGPGMHFGEWWGAGCQRKYGLDHKRFSLFNTTLWEDAEFKTPNLHVVPVIARGMFNDDLVELAVERLKREGSLAAPGFMDPEGIVVFHTASNTPFKYTLDGDGHKG